MWNYPCVNAIGPHWQRVIISGSGNGLAQNRHQAITWTNDDAVFWCKYMSLGLCFLTYTCTNRSQWFKSYSIAAEEDATRAKKKMKVEHSVVPVSLPVTDTPSQGTEKESPSHPPQLQPDTSEPPSRVDLLLSPQQLIDEGFPLPIANSEYGVMYFNIA